jgi:hypothetical protein
MTRSIRNRNLERYGDLLRRVLPELLTEEEKTGGKPPAPKRLTPKSTKPAGRKRRSAPR